MTETTARTNPAGGHGEASLRVRRRWWQVALRGFVAGLVVLLPAYLSMPVWLPKQMLREEMARSLSEQWGVPVRCGPIRLSWAEGVEIAGLQVASPAGYRQETMLHVETVRCSFAPLRMLFGRDLSWIKLERPVLAVESDPAGRLNVACMLGEPLRARQVSLQSARLTLQGPAMDRPVVVNVADLQLNQGSDGELDRMTMTGSVQQIGGPAPMAMRVSTRQADPDRAGQAYFHFAHLDLQQVPLAGLLGPSSPVDSLEGLCRGQLAFGVDENLRIEELTLEVLIAGLVVQPRGREPLPTIAEAGVSLSASLDAFSRRGEVRSLRLRLPGVDLYAAGSGYAEALSGRLDAVESLRLEGTVYPRRLAAMLTGRESLSEGVGVTGPVHLWLDARQDGRGHVMDVQFDANDATFRAGGGTIKPPGMRARLDGRGRVFVENDALQVDLADSRLAWDRTELTMAGRLADLGGIQRSAEIREPADVWNLLRALNRSRVGGTLEWCDPAGRELRGAWAFEGGRQPRISLSMRCPPGGRLEWGPIVKPAGVDLTLDVSATARPEQQSFRNVLLDLSVGTGRLTVEEASVELYQPGGRGDRWAAEVAGRWELIGADAVSACLAQRPSDLAATGEARGEFHFGYYEGLIETAGLARLDDLALRLGETFVKPDREPLAVKVLGEGRSASRSGSLELTGRAGRGEPVVRMAMNVEGVRTPQPSGRLMFDLPDLGWWARHSPAGERLAGGLPSGSARLEAELTATAEETSGRVTLHADDVLLPAAGGAERHRLRVDGPIDVRWTHRPASDEEDFTVFADAGGLAVSWGDWLDKQPDLPAQLAARLERRDGVLAVREATGQVGSLYFTGRAELAGDTALTLRSLSGHVNLRDAGELADLVPRWAACRPGGSMAATFAVQPTDEPGGLRLAEVDLRAENLRARWRGKDVGVGGSLELRDLRLRPKPGKPEEIELARLGHLHADALELRAGANRGWVFADIDAAHLGPVGSVRLMFDSLDDRDLMDWLSQPDPPADPAEGAKQALRFLGQEALLESPREPIPARHRKLRREEIAKLRKRAERKIVDLWTWLHPADLRVDLFARRYRNYDKNVRQVNPLDEFRLRAHLRQGRLDVSYDGGLNGGTVSGGMSADLARPLPLVHHAMDIREVHAAENIQPQISALFPGNEVNGRFSLAQDVKVQLWRMLANGQDTRCPVIPVGKAKMIATQGVVVGKGAPDFVTSVFPGLNLTRYPYKTMTGFTRYRPDGVAENEMIFHGLYDVYMIGRTDIDKNIRYTVGLVLLGGTSAEWQRDWKQGRFPVLKVTGRIEDGTLVDEHVAYPWPNETLFEVFLENNLLYRTWVNVNKQTESRK
jgi:hypothetical protein